jgi:hypothetical protein
MGGVFAVLQCVIRTGQRGFKMAKNRIDPVKLRQVSRLEHTKDHWIVDAASGGHRAKATQSLADDRTVGRQRCLRPLAIGVGGETTHHAKLHKSGPISFSQRNGRCERHFIHRSATSLDAHALATKVGVVDLDDALEPMTGVARGHGEVDLVVQQPSGRLARTELAFERQRIQASPHLTDQLDGQETGGLSQLGVLPSSCLRSAMLDGCSHCTGTGAERLDRLRIEDYYRSVGNESRQANERPSTHQRNVPR